MKRPDWFLRYCWFFIGLMIGLGLWMFCNVHPKLAVLAGLTFTVFTTIAFEEWQKYRERQLPPEVQIRVRIAEINFKIEESEKNTDKYREKLRLLQEDPRFCFDVAGNSQTEKRFMDTIEKLDRELEPHLKKRARLRQEYDEMLQKKGYRGL